MLKLTKKDYTSIAAALHVAESNTSAPIHIHFCQRCNNKPMRSAIKFFRHAALNRIPERNAVLIFIARASERFVILGDVAAHAKLPQAFWDECEELLTEHFKQALFVEGIDALIAKISNALSEFFLPQC